MTGRHRLSDPACPAAVEARLTRSVIIYNHRVTKVGNLSALRGRLYESCVSQHSGVNSGAATWLIYQRDIQPLLPSPAAGPVTQNLAFAAVRPQDAGRRGSIAASAVDH